MKSFLRLKYRTIALPIRTFHSSAKLAARARDEKGQPLYTHKEFMDNYRRGFENGGGNWKDEENKANASGKYSEAEFKAALEKGMEQADQYIGGAIRGVWDDGFAHGKPVGIKEERVRSEQRILVEREQNESQTRRLVEEAKNASYTAGLVANPDFIKAKEEGRVEGEIEGRQQAEKKAVEKLDKALQEAEKKEKNSKERIINEYHHSRKLSTRLMRPISSIAKWGNGLSDKFKDSPINFNQATNYFLSRLYQIPKRVGEIPLAPFSSNVYRPLKHGQPERRVIGWGRNNQNRHYDHSEKYLYQFDEDKLRIKDLYNSKIIRYNRDAAFIGLKLRLLLALGSLAFVTELILVTYDGYIHGETMKQLLSRTKVNRLCERLNVSTPEFYNTTAFTTNEEKKIKECKQGCQDAKLFQNQMRLEMKARRISGHGDPRFFGSRELVGVYADKPDAVAVPLVKTIEDTENSIRTRIESENIEKAKREKEEQLALKKKQYEAILTSEQPSKGLGK